MFYTDDIEKIKNLSEEEIREYEINGINEIINRWGKGANKEVLLSLMRSDKNIQDVVIKWFDEADAKLTEESAYATKSLDIYKEVCASHLKNPETKNLGFNIFKIASNMKCLENGHIKNINLRGYGDFLNPEEIFVKKDFTLENVITKEGARKIHFREGDIITINYDVVHEVKASLYLDKKYGHTPEAIEMLKEMGVSRFEFDSYLSILKDDYLKQYAENYHNVINYDFDKMNHSKTFCERFHDLSQEQKDIILRDMNAVLYKERENMRANDNGKGPQYFYYNELMFSPIPNESREEITVRNGEWNRIAYYASKLDDEHYADLLKKFDSQTDHSKRMIDSQAIVSKYESTYPNNRAESLGLEIDKNHLLNFVREYISYNSEGYQGIKKYITTEHRPYSDKDMSLTIFNALDNVDVDFNRLSATEKKAIDVLTGKDSQWFIEKAKDLSDNLLEPEFHDFYKVPQVPDILKESCDRAKVYLANAKAKEKIEKAQDRIELMYEIHENDLTHKQ